MKKIKLNDSAKKVLVLGGALAVGLSFNTIVEAGNNIYEQIKINANEEIGKAGYDKKQELVGNINASVEGAVQGKIDPKINESKENVENELDAYFNKKIEGITETENYKKTEGEIKVIESSVTKRFKGEIDKAFEGL